VGAGVPLEDGDAERLADGDWRAGDAIAIRSPARPFALGEAALRRARRLEPAIVTINPMTMAHWRRRMSEAYGGIAAVARG
jgi:hypothetical protein